MAFWRKTAATLIALCFTLPLAAPALADDVPLPENDPFYAVPAHIGKLANGTILDSRQVNASFFSIPMLGTAWQVKYKSLDNHGRPTADVETILVPATTWTGNGPRPLVSYQTAEDGVGSKCAPSYALRAGLADAASNSEPETGLMQLAMLRGFAVVAPDYEGPDSEFFGAAGYTHSILDGVRAAHAFTPSGLRRAPTALWGYSGGALATSLAAQAQPDYAPDVKLSGVVLGGVVAEIRKTIDAFSGSPFGGALPMGIAAVDRAYPALHLQSYLNANGRSAVAASQSDCITDAVGRFPFAKIEDFEAAPHTLDVPVIARLLHRISPLGFGGTPSAPVFDYHATNDELAPVGPDRDLMRAYCEHGVAVEHRESPVDEHISLVVTGAPSVLNWLSSRFAGATPTNNCATIPASNSPTVLGQLLAGHPPTG